MIFRLLKKNTFGILLILSSAAFSQANDTVAKAEEKLDRDSQIIEGIKEAGAKSVENGKVKQKVVEKVEDVKADEKAEEIRLLKEKIAKLEVENSNLNKEASKADQNVSKAPSSKFDLSDWTLSVPSDADGNGKADQIKEKELVKDFSNEYFYLNKDGGMVFTSPIKGAKTSTNTTYTRSELREMLRAGNTKIKTKGPNGNNWVLESSNSKYTAGGYNGQLNATLMVNHVTTTGDPKQVGRVIIGQIHAEHNEPLRIYYRKLPNNTKGSIYFAHEGRDNDKEDYYELIGSKSSKAENPEDGIALGEKFSYKVLVYGENLTVKIIKADKSIAEKTVNMKKSGYDHKDEYMYFKAGVYNQNKTGEPDDYAQATFYELENKHQKYVEPTYD